MNSTEIAIFGIACAAIGGLIGHLISNRLAINRDRRHEFNSLIEPVHDLVYHWGTPDELTILKIRERLNCWQRTGFDKAIESYKKSQNEDNRNSYSPEAFEIYEGGGRFKKPDLVERAANDLLCYLKRR